jgi:UDP-GlcNAc:undecaprenyl-phosphate GlcNAc-1-phosphate transferase
VLVIGAFCSLTAIGATLSVYNHNEYLAYGVMACVFALLVVTRLFGHHECVLLVKRLKGLTRSLIPSFSSTENRSGENIQTRLRGHRQWEDLWETLTNYGDRFDLQAIQLNVSLPRIGEEFHANWRQPNSGADESELFHANIPLHAHGMVVGRLRIAGIAGVTDIFEGIGELIAGLTPVEMHLCDLLDNCEQEESPEAQVAELVGESFTATQTS